MAIYLMVGEIHSDVRHIKEDMTEVKTEVRSLKKRVGVLERLRRFRIPYKELSGLFLGLSALLAAVAHRWDLVGQIIPRVFGK